MILRYKDVNKHRTGEGETKLKRKLDAHCVVYIHGLITHELMPYGLKLNK